MEFCNWQNYVRLNEFNLSLYLGKLKRNENGLWRLINHTPKSNTISIKLEKVLVVEFGTVNTNNLAHVFLVTLTGRTQVLGSQI